MTIRLAISPINWCNDDDTRLGEHISFEQCIKEIAEAGFVGTELGHKFPKEADKLLAALAPHALSISSAWFGCFFTVEGQYQKTLENFMERISFLRAVGAKVINVCECGYSIQQTDLPLFSENKPLFTETQWRRLIQGIHALGRIANDYDVQLSYHYHLGTGVQTREEIDFFMQHTSPYLVGLLLDTGHAIAADIDVQWLLDTYGDRINQVHLKDVRQNVLAKVKKKEMSFLSAVREGLFTVPGDLDKTFDAIIEKLLKINYQGWWVVEAEQDPDKANPLLYAKKARKYIHQKSKL